MRFFRLTARALRLTFGVGVGICLWAAPSPAERLPVAMPEELLPELDRLLETALRQSPRMITAALITEQVRANYLVSRAVRLPAISANATYAISESKVQDTAAPRSESDGLYYSAGFSLPLFHWGALKWQTDIARLEILFQEINTGEAFRVLAQTIRTQYLALIYQNLLERNSRFALDQAVEFLELQEAKLASGTLPASAIIEPRLRVQEAQLNRDAVAENLRYAAEGLALLCGAPPINLGDLPTEVPGQTFAAAVRGAYLTELAGQTAIEDTAELRSNELRLRQDRLRYRIIRTNTLPKIGLSGSYGVSNINSVVGKFVAQTAVDTFSYGALVTWSIFDGLSTRGQRLSALAARRVNERARDQAIERIEGRLGSLERQIAFAGTRTELAQRRYDLARDGVRLTQQNFEAGIASRNAVNGVTNLAYQAELALVDARRNELNLWADFVSTAGLDPVLERFPEWKNLKVNGR